MGLLAVVRQMHRDYRDLKRELQKASQARDYTTPPARITISEGRGGRRRRRS